MSGTGTTPAEVRGPGATTTPAPGAATAGDTAREAAGGTAGGSGPGERRRDAGGDTAGDAGRETGQDAVRVPGRDTGTIRLGDRTRDGEALDDTTRYAPEWLQLREGVDAAARAAELLDPLRIRLADLPRGAGGFVIHDLGCGTGSMGRWLAPRLDGPQHWVLHDRDPYLLHFAAVGSPRTAADGSRVTVETQRGDVGRLTADALAGASLVTASALLDVLGADEIETLAAACAGAGCPALLTLSVVGRVDLTPAHPLDARIAAAFNDHQRRGDLLGPEAVRTACDAFSRHGATVRVHPSAWRLGPDEAALTAEWLRGWVGAAVEQCPELAEPAEEYLQERLAACAAGELRAVVHHSDLLALARPAGEV